MNSISSNLKQPCSWLYFEKRNEVPLEQIFLQNEEQSGKWSTIGDGILELKSEIHQFLDSPIKVSTCRVKIPNFINKFYQWQGKSKLTAVRNTANHINVAFFYGKPTTIIGFSHVLQNILLKINNWLLNLGRFIKN